MGRRIRVPEIRVIGPDGGQLGIMTVEQAMLVADRNGLDLVEVSPKAVPPVCRIMDYGKFKYEQAKKNRATRTHSVTVQIKEIKFRPKTEGHDMDFKMRHIRRFLGEGHKVRLAVAFKGREITHPEIGRKLLERIVKQLTDIAVVEQAPAMDARRMVMILSPKVGVVQRPTGAQSGSTASASAGAASSGAPSQPASSGAR